MQVFFTREPDDEIRTKCADSQAQNELLNIKINNKDILKKVNKLDLDKPAGPDAVHTRVPNELGNDYQQINVYRMLHLKY